MARQPFHMWFLAGSIPVAAISIVLMVLNMIEPERIFHYMENLYYVTIESDVTEGEITTDFIDEKSKKLWLDNLYMLCHIGNEKLHNCKHSDWEKKFLALEQQLIDAGHMKPYNERASTKSLREEFQL